MKNKWILLAFLCATFVLYTVDRALLGPLAISIQRDTGITDVQFGVLNAAVFWTYAALVPFAGYIGDCFNRIRLIGFASLVWSVMTVLAGFADGFWCLLLVVSVAVTAPQTLYSPAAAALIASRHAETRTVALSLHQTAFYAGWFLSGAVVAAVLAAFGSWRAAYWCVGGAGIALAAVFIAASFRADASAAAATVARSPVEGKPSFAEAFRAVFACPTAVIAAVGHATFTFVVFGYTAWAPKYVALKFGISPGSAAFGAMFWHFSAACAAVLAAGFVTDRFVGRFPRFRLALQTCSLLAAVPLMFAFASGGSLRSVWTAAALLGVMKGAFEANSVNSMFDVVPRRCHSSAVGYMNVMSGVFGAFAPMTLGWLSQRSGVRGLELGFSSFGFVLLAAGILMGIAASRTFGRDRLAVLQKDTGDNG